MRRRSHWRPVENETPGIGIYSDARNNCTTLYQGGSMGWCNHFERLYLGVNLKEADGSTETSGEYLV